MLRMLKVAPRPGGLAPLMPKADYALSMLDFGFRLPAQVQAGQHSWAVHNDGQAPHFVMIAKFLPGKGMRDLKTYMAGHMQGQPPMQMPPQESGVLTAGRSNTLNFNLTAGEYVALCLIDDAETHKSHAELGMVQTFTVVAK